MYFPRVLAHDKLRGHFESFAPCGAVAGMLARYDEASPVWLPAEREEADPAPGIPARLPGRRGSAHAAGGPGRQYAAGGAVGRAHRRAPADPGRGLQRRNADWQYLAARRLALFIFNSIEQRHALGGRGAFAWRRLPRP